MKTNRAPSPKPHFLSGHYFDFYRNQLDFLTSCARDFGDIVYLRFFHIPIHLVNHPELIEEILAKAELRKPRTLRNRLQKRIFGNGLLASEGDFWLKQRRLLQQVFEQNRLDRYAETVVQVSEDFFKNWKSGDRRVLDDELTDLTLKIAAKTLFGIDNPEETDIIRELVESLKVIFSRQSRLSWFGDNFLPTANNRRFKKAVKDVNSLIASIVESRRKHNSERYDLLSVLLITAAGNSDNQIRDEVVTFFIAGHETTALALTWAWVLLSTNHEAAWRLGIEARAFDQGELSFRKLHDLTVTGQILKESLRMFPPNRSVVREVTKSCNIRKFHFPKGSQIVMSQWVLHRDSRYFESPDRFMPERWTSEFERNLPKYAYFPFGLGNRTCIGRSFAFMETTLILAIMARQFAFTLDPGQEMAPVPVILLRPKNKLNITVKSLDRVESRLPNRDTVGEDQVKSSHLAP